MSCREIIEQGVKGGGTAGSTGEHGAQVTKARQG